MSPRGNDRDRLSTSCESSKKYSRGYWTDTQGKLWSPVSACLPLQVASDYWSIYRKHSSVEAKCSWCNMSNTKYRVRPHFRTPRKSWKYYTACSGVFLTKLGCLEMWWNTVCSVWYISSQSKLKLRYKRKTKCSMLIKITHQTLSRSWFPLVKLD